MKNFYQRFCLLILLALFNFSAFAQDLIKDKLDPAFYYLLAKEKYKQSNTINPVPPNVVITPAEGYAYKGASKERRYNCIIYTTNGTSLRDSGLVINSVLPLFATGWLTLSQLEWVTTLSQVSFVEAPSSSALQNDVTVGNSGTSLLHAGRLNNTVFKGAGVIIAVYDSGIDWDHPDFRNPQDQTKSRILRIWDQTITATVGEAPPTGFSYGVEYTQAQINDELDGSPANFVRERDINGHGTHVAGTAAGNGSALPSRKYAGMAPEADIIVIKGGNTTFPASNTIDAITYIKNLANTLGRPIVLNMSQGNQIGPHDGTLPEEQAVDNFTASGPGRVVVAAAGNDNGANSSHIRNTINAGGSGSAVIAVPSSTAGTDVFEFSTFAFSNGAVSVTVTSPTNDVLTSTGNSTSGTAMSGNFNVSINNSLYSTNGKRYVNVYVARNGSNTVNPQGNWTVSITNNTGSTMTFDGWISYRNTSFPSITIVGGDNNNMVSSPGNAASAITVASSTGKLKWYSATAGGTYTYNAPEQQDNVSLFSNGGPRRDGLQKPEVTTHGAAVSSVLSSDATSIDATVAGLYQRMQGTSMASPGVAGAAALLLQANPTATYTQVKNWITSNAFTDGLTGAVPNARWGYGRLDAFKAVSTAIGCTSVERKIYQYDNSMTASSDGLGVTQGTGRLATRFSPDINGMVGGVFIHPSASITDLTIAIHAAGASGPGAQLAAMNFSSASSGIVVGGFNYLDLSSLNVPIVSGTEYYIVVYRAPSSTANWSLRYDNSTTATRSYTSTDGGVTWNATGYVWRIRPVVYSTPAAMGVISTTNSTDLKIVTTNTSFISACRNISMVSGTGTNPVSGSTTAKVFIEGSLPTYNGRIYAARHYDIVPQANPGAATATVTLYFTAAEFNAYNADARSTVDLPVGNADGAGKAALRIFRFAGTASSATGLPASYGTGPINIDPDDAGIVYNTAAARWEVTFETTGFGGYMVGTTSSILPVLMEYFTGERRANGNHLRWKATCLTTGNVRFEVERSTNGTTFTSIGSVSVSELECNRAMDYLDATPAQGANYYRLRMVEANGTVKYTGVLLLQTGGLVTTVNPTLLPKGAGLNVAFGGARGQIVVLDNTGRQLFTHSLISGTQLLHLPLLASGAYYYTVLDETGLQLLKGKLTVE